MSFNCNTLISQFGYICFMLTTKFETDDIRWSFQGLKVYAYFSWVMIAAGVEPNIWRLEPT